MVKRAKNGPVRALTLRIPREDYNLLRAEAFVTDTSINAVAVIAIQKHVAGDRRTLLEAVLSDARVARAMRGRSTEIPRNPLGKGPR